MDETEQAIAETIPTCEGTWKKKVFGLVQRLKALPGLAHVTAESLGSVVERWHRQAKAKRSIGQVSLAEARAVFAASWQAAKAVVGTRDIDKLFERAKQAPPPSLDIGHAQPGILLLAAWCRELQEHARQSGEDEFFLSCRQAAQLLNVDYATAARWLKRLQTLGVLKLCERGTRAMGNASRFRYLGEPAAVEPAAGEQTVA